MSTSILQTAEVKALLEKASGLDQSGGNERVKQIMHRLLSDLFRLIDDFDVSPEEFWHAANFLGELGRSHENTLVAPGLGFDRFLDIRMDAADQAAGLAGGTPRAIEGPLYVAGAPLSKGHARMDDGTDGGESMWLTGRVCDTDGNPIAGAIVDIWHANTMGGYSYFDTTQSEFNLRRRIETGADGRYSARSIIPSGYGCPPDGPTSQLLSAMGRHGQRPAHIHFFISAPGYRHLTTQINLAGDEYLHDDFAFATRDELIVEARRIDDPAEADKRGLEGAFQEVVFDVSLVATATPDKQQRHKRQRALESA